LKTVALVVLLLVWGALIATWLRSRAQDGGFGDPVGTFNHHLRVLEKTSPPKYPAANQRRPTRSNGISPYRQVSPAVPAARGHRGPRPTAHAAHRRAQSQKRRRDVFFALTAGVVGSLILGIIPGLHAMLYIQGLFDVLTVAYLALLVRKRNLAAERELKLAYMPGNRRVQAAGYAPVQPTPRAVTGRESYQDEYDYEFDYSYNELAVRRAAN
jgi:hypothetical protein